MRLCHAPGCGRTIDDRSRRTLYCSPACKQAAYEARHGLADPAEGFWSAYPRVRRRGRSLTLPGGAR